MDVQQKVAALIRRYKTDDPFRLAACKNIIIMYSDLAANTATISNINVQNSLLLTTLERRKPCCRSSVRTNLAMRFVRPMTIPSGSRPTPWISMQTGWRDWQTCLL